MSSQADLIGLPISCSRTMYDAR